MKINSIKYLKSNSNEYPHMFVVSYRKWSWKSFRFVEHEETYLGNLLYYYRLDDAWQLPPSNVLYSKFDQILFKNKLSNTKIGF